MKYCKDAFTKEWGQKKEDLDNMLDFFKARSQNSKWIEVQIQDTRREIIPRGPMFTGEVKNVYKLSVDEDAILDTQFMTGKSGGSQFILSICEGKGDYLISDMALDGLSYNIIGNTSNFKKLSKKYQKEALDVFALANPEKTLKMFFSGDKIRAIQSDKYAPLDQYILIVDLLKELRVRMGKDNIKLERGFYNHSNTRLTFSILNDSIFKEYRKKLLVSGIYNSKKIVPYVVFATSDAGASSAKMSAGFKFGKEEIELGNILAVEHARNNTTKTFSGNLKNLFAGYADLAEKINKLMDIKIKYPLNTLKYLLADIKFPEIVIPQALDCFYKEVVENRERPVDAHDIFIFSQISVNRLYLSDKKKTKMKENIIRLLNKDDWKKYDKPM